MHLTSSSLLLIPMAILAAATTAPHNTCWIGDRCAVVARLYAFQFTRE